MRKKFYEYLIEALLIVFSVILALFLNEYRTNLKSEKELKLVLSNVKSEVEINKRILEELIPYHEGISNSLDSIIASDSAVNSLKLEDGYGLNLAKIIPQGIYQNPLGYSAWEIAESRGYTSQIDIEIAQNLARTYLQQEITLTPGIQIYDFVTTRDFLEQDKAKANLIILSNFIGELYSREKALLRYYNNVLEILK